MSSRWRNNVGGGHQEVELDIVCEQDGPGWYIGIMDVFAEDGDGIDLYTVDLTEAQDMLDDLRAAIEEMQKHQ